MKTSITEMFDIEFPIMAFSHCRDVVAAVSKAGGLGVLGAVGHTANGLEIDLEWIEAEVGDKPYGVDLIIPAKYAGDADGGFTVGDINGMIPDEHRAFVDDILERYDVPVMEDAGRGQFKLDDGGAAPFAANAAGPLLDISLAHHPALMVNALGPTAPL